MSVLHQVRPLLSRVPDVPVTLSSDVYRSRNVLVLFERSGAGYRNVVSWCGDLPPPPNSCCPVPSRKMLTLSFPPVPCSRGDLGALEDF